MWRPEVHKELLELHLTHKVLLHTCLYYTASHLRLLTNSNKFTDVLIHRGAVMHLINKGLDDPILRASDSIIGALGYLIVFDVSNHFQVLSQCLCSSLSLK